MTNGRDARAATRAIDSATARPEAASRFERVVLVALDLAVERGAERVEGEDLARAAAHVRREVCA